MAYLDAEAARRFMGAEAPDDDDLLGALIAAAQQEIDDHCRRTFEARTETRSYSDWYRGRSPNGRVLYLDDDLLSVTTLTNGDAALIASTGYWLEPRGMSPYSMIRLKSSNVWIFNTDASIAIAGTWGYSTTPSATIIQATRRMVSYLYHQRSVTVFDVTAEPGQGVIYVPQGVPKDVEVMLRPFRRDSYY